MDTGQIRTGRERTSQAGLNFVPAMVLLFVMTGLDVRPADALSEIKRNEIPQNDSADKKGKAAEPDIETTPIPLPDPIISPDADQNPRPDDSINATPGRELDPDAELPDIQYDTSKLPDEVGRMRDLIIEACRSGDIEALRPLLGTGADGTQLTFAGAVSDQIKTLRSFSGDDQGHEIMAILLEVLEAGYVHLDPGEPTELYVWPYFFAMPLERLSNPQRVELFKILTAGDFEDMKSFGAYIFYRVGITPEGRWLFFVAGD